MRIDRKTLERLAYLDLKLYAGDLGAFIKEDYELREALMVSPVEVKLISARDICDDSLYTVVERFVGRYEKFQDLRYGLTKELIATLPVPAGYNLLTSLFNGIYIGDPEDVLNFRLQRGDKIMYPVKGLGEKLADVIFLDNTHVEFDSIPS